MDSGRIISFRWIRKWTFITGSWSWWRYLTYHWGTRLSRRQPPNRRSGGIFLRGSGKSEVLKLFLKLRVHSLWRSPIGCDWARFNVSLIDLIKIKSSLWRCWVTFRLWSIPLSRMMGRKAKFRESAFLRSGRSVCGLFYPSAGLDEERLFLRLCGRSQPVEVKVKGHLWKPNAECRCITMSWVFRGLSSVTASVTKRRASSVCGKDYYEHNVRRWRSDYLWSEQCLVNTFLKI